MVAWARRRHEERLALVPRPPAPGRTTDPAPRRATNHSSAPAAAPAAVPPGVFDPSRTLNVSRAAEASRAFQVLAEELVRRTARRDAPTPNILAVILALLRGRPALKTWNFDVKVTPKLSAHLNRLFHRFGRMAYDADSEYAFPHTLRFWRDAPPAGGGPSCPRCALVDAAGAEGVPTACPKCRHTFRWLLEDRPLAYRVTALPAA